MGPTLLFLASCTVVRFGAPDVAHPPGAAASPAEVGGVSLAGLVLRIEALLALTEDVDRRDRLVELLDLATAASKLDPMARRRVATFVERTVVIEERTSPIALAESPMQVSESVSIVIEEPLGGEPVVVAPAEGPPAVPEPGVVVPGVVAVPDPLVALRGLLAAGDYLAVVAVVDGSPELASRPDALALRTDAANAWAGAEREAAAAEFLVARDLAPPERATRLGAVLARLSAINSRFPENAFAAEIQKHIGSVNAELAK